MTEVWFNVLCPGCGQKNWWSDDPNDGDSSKMDVGRVACWCCHKDIVLFVGQYGEEYRPHVCGTEPTDEFDQGNYEHGRRNPE